MTICSEMDNGDLRILRKLIVDAKNELDKIGADGGQISRAYKADVENGPSNSANIGKKILMNGLPLSIESVEEGYKTIALIQNQIFQRHVFLRAEHAFDLPRAPRPFFIQIYLYLTIMLSKVIGLFGRHSAVIKLADIARDSRDYKTAAKLYAEVCSSLPNYYDMWVQQGNMAKDARLFDQAVAAYKAAMDLRHDDADLYLQLGHLCKIIGDNEGAARAYASALRYSPHNLIAIKELNSLGFSDSDFAGSFAS